MTDITPKERIKRFFNREPIDVMPVFSGQGMVTIQAIEKMGVRFAQIHTSAEYMARSAMTTAEMFGFDAVIIPYDMCTVPEALGRGASLYENANGILYPTVPSKWKTLDDVKIDSEFMTKGRMPLVDDAIRILKSSSNGKFAVGSWVLGPFTMAGQLLELDVLLKGLKKEKEKVEEFLSKMTDLVIEVARHYQELGVDYMNIREMGSGTDIISPRMWKMLVLDNLQKVFSALRSPKVLHICGSTDMIIELMNECGADALSVDQKNDVIESRRKLGNDVLILGNFDPYGTMVQMDVSGAESVIKKCIDDGVDAVWPGCDLWPEVKKENVEAYVRTVREYSKKASPAVGRI
jgi:[methyl-Co(III) methanol/glycine betaine-specific corrinoid protein]:coenzyme M methyltransferase